MSDSNESNNMAAWPPSAFKQMQEATEQTINAQNEMYKRFLSATSGMDVDGFAPMSRAWSDVATFKTRMQSGGRISIPDAERDALDIEEGDLLQTIVIPIRRDTE